MTPPPTWQRWLSLPYLLRRLSHQFWIKLLTLLVAIALWFAATADRRANIEQGFDVQVTTTDLTGNETGKRTVSGLAPENVKVYLRGKPQLLADLRKRPQALEAIVDLTDAPVGGFTKRVTVRPPPGTTLIRIEPERVQGFVDLRSSRTLPISPGVTLTTEDSIPRYEIVPQQARVTGPSRVVDQVQRLVTVPLPMTAGEVTETPVLALDADNKPLPDVNISPTSVTIRRLDTGNLPIKTLDIVLNKPPATLKVTQISLQPSSVRVVAAPELLAELREIPGNVQYRAGTYSAPVNLRIPTGAQALENVSVRLTVEKVYPTPAKP